MMSTKRRLGRKKYRNFDISPLPDNQSFLIDQIDLEEETVVGDTSDHSDHRSVDYFPVSWSGRSSPAFDEVEENKEGESGEGESGEGESGEDESGEDESGEDESGEEQLTYRTIPLEVIVPRLIHEEFQGQMVVQYRFQDIYDWSNHRRLLPNSQELMLSKNWSPFGQQDQKKRAKMKKRALAFNQLAQVVTEIEKKRKLSEPIVHYAKNDLDRKEQQLDFMVNLKIKLVRMPVYLNPDWIQTQSEKMSSKYQPFFRKMCMLTLTCIEYLERLIYFYQPDLQQMQEVGTVYNGLVNTELLCDLTELFHDLIVLNCEIQRTKSKIPSSEWPKTLYQPDEFTFNLELNWQVKVYE